jgi:hypothetical protein
MTDHDLEQGLRAWYRADIDDRESAPLQLRTDLARLAQTAAGSGRRLRAGWRFPFVNRFAAVGLAAAAIVVALISIGLILGSRNVGPAPLPGPTHAATPRPSPAAASTAPFVRPGAVEPGRYRMYGPMGQAGWPGRVIVTIPDGWSIQKPAFGAALRRSSPAVAELVFTSVGNLVVDPCFPGGDWGPLLEPPLGPSVDDLVAGLRSLRLMEFGEPVDVTLDGWDGKRLELIHPAGCGSAVLGITPPAGGDIWGVYSREGWHSTLWILDIDGLRFVVVASYVVDAPADAKVDLQQMVDSIDIEP